MYTRSAERSRASLKGTAEPLCLGWHSLWAGLDIGGA